MRKILSIWALFLCATACVYPYTPELDEAPEGVLAVDANISIGDVSSVRVSSLRSVWPSDNVVFPDLRGVQVWVEDETGETYPGAPDPAYFGYYDFIYFPGNALYTIATENAPADRRYRLCIKTPDARYASDWTEVEAPPVIKNIDFTADDMAVSVNVSVDGGAAATGYFLLSYDETWEFHADYIPRYAVTVMGARVSIQQSSPDYSRYWCWKSSNNNQIYPVDYTAMSQAGVTSWPLTRFSRRDNRNHKRYCVTVKARNVSKETFRFLKNLETNTGYGDNLFTPTPGELPSNLHCESDPERTVLGYVLFSQTTSKRAWLDSRYGQQAPLSTLLYPEQDQFREFYESGFLPLEELLPEQIQEGMGPYGWGGKYCYDCTAVGGTQQKPTFWDDEE